MFGEDASTDAPVWFIQAELLIEAQHITAALYVIADEHEIPSVEVRQINQAGIPTANFTVRFQGKTAWLDKTLEAPLGNKAIRKCLITKGAPQTCCLCAEGHSAFDCDHEGPLRLSESLWDTKDLDDITASQPLLRGGEQPGM